MFLTRKQWVDSLSVAVGLLVEECLSMEVDTLKVFGRTHVDQVPAHKLIGVHSQALQVVYNAIDGLGNNRQIEFLSIFSQVIIFYNPTVHCLCKLACCVNLSCCVEKLLGEGSFRPGQSEVNNALQ